MRLAAIFALVALGLACVGVYGVMAYSVAKRRVEFGVRLALGARPASVVGLVVREGGRLALVGLGVGTIAAFNLTTLLRSQLYGVTSRDLTSYLVAIPVLGLAAMLACWLPARRATSGTPLDALRSE
jgi:ABC-type antimicrobial peptide transport system permease subunit